MNYNVLGFSGKVLYNNLVCKLSNIFSKHKHQHYVKTFSS